MFSRRVAICHATNPEKFADEVRRVLKASGRLGLDFMNKEAQSKHKMTRIDQINGKMYYVEMFTEEGKQKRVSYLLPKAVSWSLQTTGASFSRSLATTLAGINLETLPKEEWWAILYTPDEAKRLVRNSGFEQIKTFPLGSFARGMSNPSVRNFLIENRDRISAVQKELAGIFRLDKAVHVFLTATAP